MKKKTRDLCCKIQEIKGKLVLRVKMLNNKQGSKLSIEEKMKGENHLLKILSENNKG